MNALNESQETRRREAIRDYGLLDTPGEAAYDDLCRLAAHVCAAPIAAISLTDVDRQWIKAAVGVGTASIPREDALCPKEKGKGTGLGLSTVYGIAQQAGGHVEVWSRAGEGSAFTVYLPAVEAAQAPPVPEPRPLQQAKGILVVEDASDIRHLVRKILEARGYRVFEAPNALDALLELSNRKGHVRLVVTDVMLPGLRGVDLLARVRAAWPDVKVLAMSGHPEGPEGVDGFIAKPFTPDGLVRAVQAALGD